MEIEYGSTVRDKNGKVLGTVNRVLRDTYTGDITKFTVESELADADLFYGIDDVNSASGTDVELKIAFGESNLLGIQYGARVFDSNGRLLGTVDYPVTDTLTGEIKRFKVNTGTSDEGIFFSVDDVLQATPAEVKLKAAAR